MYSSLPPDCSDIQLKYYLSTGEGRVHNHNDMLKVVAHLRGAVRFLLHAKQANFLYLAHLGDFSQRFQ